MPKEKAYNEAEVLERAMQLFWRKGYHGVSMEELVTKLGVNRASLYENFDSKETLFFLSLQRYMKGIGIRLQAVMESETSVLRALDRVFEEIAQGLSSDTESRGCFAINSATGFPPESDRIRGLIAKGKQWETELFRNYLEKAIGQGELPRDSNTSQLADYLYALHGGLTVLSKVDNNPEYLTSIARTALCRLQC